MSTSPLQLIVFSNGIYDLTNNSFRDIQPDDDISVSVGYDYEDYADKTDIINETLSFVESFHEDKQILQYLMVYFASLLEGVKTDTYMIWRGDRANGKTLLIKLFETAFAGYADYGNHIVHDMLIDNMFTAGNEKKRVLILSDIYENNDLQSMIIQRMVHSNDAIDLRELFKGNKQYEFSKYNITIPDRFKHRRAFEFRPHYNLLQICNVLPVIDYTQHHHLNNIKILEFPLAFVTNPTLSHERERKKVDINKYIKPFMWLLLNIYRPLYKEHGLNMYEPLNVTNATSKYKQQLSFNHIKSVTEWN